MNYRINLGMIVNYRKEIIGLKANVCHSFFVVVVVVVVACITISCTNRAEKFIYTVLLIDTSYQLGKNFFFYWQHVNVDIDRFRPREIC